MREAMREQSGMALAPDEELYEVLIAISVVARLLAGRHLRKQEGDKHEQNE